ncbi:hypothetical protein EW146_g4106 [Bondarzewia mesenterica]|uniref:NADP-dependent oxidoreductase domain-containing protein n=1 Tax=Bondarzewia mesenterica TaxID=1095465 RepID=A0A4S4LVH7_9AGAM|nr:hypothetical protein EW146_g4106 [Bondarzewia mesenterica]
MLQKTARVVSDVAVAKTGYGLMMMTWKPAPVPDEEAFDAIKAGIGNLLYIDKIYFYYRCYSGEFYGINPLTANLELVARFFEKYLAYADKVFLSVKGSTARAMPGAVGIDCSPENLRRSADRIMEKLRGTKKLDLFQSPRVDPKYSIEKTMKVLWGLVSEGKFDYIGLSECGAETVRRASSAGLVTAVEIEDMKHNFAIVNALKAIADKKGITAAQLCIAWVATLGPQLIPLPGSSNKKRTLENLAGGDIELPDMELAEIHKVLATHTVLGGRYRDEDSNAELLLWG